MFRQFHVRDIMFLVICFLSNPRLFQTYGDVTSTRHLFNGHLRGSVTIAPTVICLAVNLSRPSLANPISCDRGLNFTYEMSALAYQPS